VYGFVRQSGGRVQIDTAPGQGTTVRLQLPRAPQAASELALPVDIPDVTSQDELVLLLEDEADVRQTLCEQLHQLGYITLEAQTVEEAITLLDSVEDIGILISDLMLPGGVSGAEVLHYAAINHPHIARLLISGQDLRAAQDPAAQPDVELLRKPFTQVQLAQALRRTCHP